MLEYGPKILALYLNELILNVNWIVFKNHTARKLGSRCCSSKEESIIFTLRKIYSLVKYTYVNRKNREEKWKKKPHPYKESNPLNGRERVHYWQRQPRFEICHEKNGMTWLIKQDGEIWFDRWAPLKEQTGRSCSNSEPFPSYSASTQTSKNRAASQPEPPTAEHRSLTSMQMPRRVPFLSFWLFFFFFKLRRIETIFYLLSLQLLSPAVAGSALTFRANFTFSQ